MNKILHIDTSLHGKAAASSLMADRLVENLARQGGLEVVHRDLGALDIPHLDGEQYDGFRLEPEQRNLAQRAAVVLSDTLINELRDSETIVLAMPMYNFGVPSAFKAWIDHVARAGETFRYTENGPEGLLKNKKLIVIATRGGKYAGTDADHQTAYLQQVFGFMGLQDIEFVYAEGLAMSGVRDDAIANAVEQLDELVAA